MERTAKVINVWNVGPKDQPHAIPAKPPGSVRFVCISDTHESEMELEIPDGDILLHAGDFSYKGEEQKITEFNSFLGTLPHQYKIVIAGNHDITFHKKYYEKSWHRFHRVKQDCKKIKTALTNCIYLEDSGVTLMGFAIYGSPWQPAFCDWAFNLPRGPSLREVWDKIPPNTDILMTHGPPKGHGDITKEAGAVGCDDLLEAMRRIRPIMHVFGHIHEGYGISKEGSILCVNASSETIDYEALNRPIVVDISSPQDMVTTDCELTPRRSKKRKIKKSALCTIS